MNKERIQQKRKLIDLTRSYFSGQGFFELETPLLVPSPGMEVHLHGFQTDYIDHQGYHHKFYLPTSPEFSIKKALGSGFEKVFEIARVFRNHGELGNHHHPEFNMLEWYRPGDYVDIMEDVSSYLGYLSQHFPRISNEQNFAWDQGTKRRRISDCFEKYAQMNLEKGLSDMDYWSCSAQKVLGESIPGDDSFEDIFFRVWMKLIEPNLGSKTPEIVFEYPASMAALAKLKNSQPIWAERFELYIKGVEIGNAFSELTDSGEQEHRFHLANQERESLGYPPHPKDMDLISSVGKMKRSGGIAIGIERLLMVLTGETDIRQFFLYPVGDTKRKKKVKDDLDPREPNTTAPS